MEFHDYLEQAFTEGKISLKLYKLITLLYESFQDVLKSTSGGILSHDKVFIPLLARVIEQVESPYNFEPYHKKITEPFDYYKLGIEFVRPLIDEKASHVLMLENVDKMQQQLNAKENVILFANHQTEADPQILSHALEKEYYNLVSEMIFVAGDRVINDPLAVPFSMGRNLLCIYSKRYIANPPEKKVEKQHHNHKVMRRMSQLFAEGGKCVFVAPSGGRDRPNSEGDVIVAPFDPASIEMFRLMAIQGKRPAHFYPLALDTYKILPPPDTVKWELGEPRIAHKDGIRCSFGNEIDMQNFPGSDNTDRTARKEALALHIWNLVNAGYETLKKRKT